MLSSRDLIQTVTPQLDVRSFVALRGMCSEFHAATQRVCEDLIQVLERAFRLYVSPQFAEGLQLISEHQPHVCWLLQVSASITPPFRPILCSCHAPRGYGRPGATVALVHHHPLVALLPRLRFAPRVCDALSPSRVRCVDAQSPVLAVVAIDRYDGLVGNAYHLLQVSCAHVLPHECGVAHIYCV